MDRTTTVTNPYTWTDPTWSSIDLTGYSVEARDGGIGSIDEATYEVGADHLIVDTGPWIFGKKVMLPASVVSRIDQDEKRVFVNLAKEQIENAPQFDESGLRDSGYRDELGTYYTTNRPAGPDYGRDDRAI